METQTIFNFFIGGISALGMWVLNSITASMATLHKSDIELSAKVQNIELLVTGAYAKREEIDRLSSALFAKLDKIENKLDGKADKTVCEQIHNKFNGVRHD